MNRSVLPLTCLLLLATPSAWAQVRLQIELGLPVAPPLVVIQPGIQVVEGFGEEVFFHNGWYWCRRHDGWYRARTPRARFAWVEVHRVPRRLVEVPMGRYRDWHHDRGVRPQERHDLERRGLERRDLERREQQRREGHRELRREERREDQREDQRQHKELKEERRDERRDERGRERRDERDREGREHRREH